MDKSLTMSEGASMVENRKAWAKIAKKKELSKK